MPFAIYFQRCTSLDASKRLVDTFSEDYFFPLLRTAMGYNLKYRLCCFPSAGYNSKLCVCVSKCGVDILKFWVCVSIMGVLIAVRVSYFTLSRPPTVPQILGKMQQGCVSSRNVHWISISNVTDFRTSSRAETMTFGPWSGLLSHLKCSRIMHVRFI